MWCHARTLRTRRPLVQNFLFDSRGDEVEDARVYQLGDELTGTIEKIALAPGAGSKFVVEDGRRINVIHQMRLLAVKLANFIRARNPRNSESEVDKIGQIDVLTRGRIAMS